MLGHPYMASSIPVPSSPRLYAYTIRHIYSHVWRDLFKMAGIKLCMSTTFHPQTDGQSEAPKKTIAMYLRCIIGDQPRAWVD
ncbi:hypothetical protein U9M48_039400 [Paspalum notatum var. saurae]|uniref:Integrase catalytic domain-containing protein n=1 Tax=Paspalum notatum var. saurae TaxID=547442 RepID=A0AAQ3UNW5_PASNO